MATIADKPKRVTAADLIAAKAPPTHYAASEAALSELRALCEYNDGQSGPQRVGAKQACAMLREYGWEGKTHYDLDRLCHRALGRKSWGTP